jgi:hypothetical protein
VTRSWPRSITGRDGPGGRPQPNAIDTIASRKCDCTRSDAGRRARRAADDPVAEDRDQHHERRDLQPARTGRTRNAPIAISSVGMPDQAAEEPVDLLDRRVAAGDVDESFVVAVRPVVAAEAAAGEADDGAGDVRKHTPATVTIAICRKRRSDIVNRGGRRSSGSIPPQDMASVGRVLSSFDDFPIHQTSQPIAQTATSDINHYDRYFFNGYTKDTRLFFATAMGLYPNRHVVDASFSVVVDGGTAGARQISVHASGRAPGRPGRRQRGRPDPRRGARAAQRAARRRRGTRAGPARRPHVRAPIGADRGAALLPADRVAGHVRLHAAHPVRRLGGLDRDRRRTDDLAPARRWAAATGRGVSAASVSAARPVRRSPTRSSSGCGRRSTSTRSRRTSTSTSCSTASAGTRPGSSPRSPARRRSPTRGDAGGRLRHRVAPGHPHRRVVRGHDDTVGPVSRRRSASSRSSSSRWPGSATSIPSGATACGRASSKSGGERWDLPVDDPTAPTGPRAVDRAGHHVGRRSANTRARRPRTARDRPPRPHRPRAASSTASVPADPVERSSSADGGRHGNSASM